MEKILDSFINQKRINLISKVCGEAASKEIKKEFNKALENSLDKLDHSTIEFLNLISKIDNIADLTTDNKENYTVGNRKIHVINSDKQLTTAIKQLSNAKLIGFDSEQKPVFQKGVKPRKISIIQMADAKNCYVFQLFQIKNVKPILDILTNRNIVKVGFGLTGDTKSLFDEFRIRIKSCIDVGTLFRTKLYYQNDVGAKKATLLFLDLNLQKSSKATKSNWETKILSESQVKYAAEDATCVYDCFIKMLQDYPFLVEILPIWFKRGYENGHYDDY